MSQLSDFNFKNGIIGQAIQGLGYKTGLIKRLQPLARKRRFHIGVPRGVTGELAKDYNQTMKLFSRLTPNQKSNFVKTLQTFYNEFPNATPQLKVEYVAALMHHFLKGGPEIKDGDMYPDGKDYDFPWWRDNERIKKLGNKYVQETKMSTPQFIPWVHPSLRNPKTSYLSLVLVNNGGLFGGGDFAGGGAGGDFGVDRGNTYKDNNFIGLVLPYEKRNFEQAYAEARRQGLDTFEFNGKTYSTAYDTSNDPERAKRHKEAAQSRKLYGIIGLGKWEK